MKQRMATNSLKDENTKLRTRLHMTENELTRKDKIIDELLHQSQTDNLIGANRSGA